MALELFDFFMTMMEYCCFATTLTTFFQIEGIKKTAFLAILLMIASLGLNPFSPIIAITFVIVIAIVFLIYQQQRWHALYLMLPIVLMMANLLFHQLSAWWIAYNLKTTLTTQTSLMMLGRVFSTTLFLFVSFLLLSFTNKNQSLKKYWIYIPLIFVLILMAVTLLSSVLSQTISMHMMYILWIEFVLLVVFSTHIFIVMNKQSKENAEMTQRLAKEEVQKNMYNITQRSMNQISADKHMMIYTLMKINQMMSSQQDSEAKTFVKKELGKYTNYKSITSTGNPFFDYEISNKINQMTARNIEVKSLFSINERNSILAEENTVYYIEKCLDEILRMNNDIEEVQLFFNEINNYLKIKIIMTYHNDALAHRQYTFEKYDLLMNYKMNQDVSYDEIIFLFKNK